MIDPHETFAAYALEVCPKRHRDDFVQECWLAYLDNGRKPGAAKAAAVAWLRRERRYEARQVACGLMMNHESASD